MKINTLQFVSMIIILIISSFLFIPISSLIRQSGTDAHLAVIFSSLIGIVMIYIFMVIFTYKPKLSLYLKTTDIFGNKWGLLINIIINVIVIINGGFIFHHLCNFILTYFLPDTSYYIVAFLILIVIIFINLKGVETISRVSFIFLVIMVLIDIVLKIGLIPKFNFNNLLPFLERGINKPLLGSLYLVSFGLSYMFIALIIPKDKIVSNKKKKFVLILAYLISIIVILSSVLFIIGVLGINLASVYNYPLYALFRNFSILGFIDGIENILSISIIMGLFFNVCLTIYFSSNIVKCENKMKYLVTSFITLVLAVFLKNNSDIYDYIYRKLFSINLTFVFIFIIIAIRIKLKKITNK